MQAVSGPSGPGAQRAHLQHGRASGSGAGGRGANRQSLATPATTHGRASGCGGGRGENRQVLATPATTPNKRDAGGQDTRCGNLSRELAHDNGRTQRPEGATGSAGAARPPAGARAGTEAQAAQAFGKMHGQEALTGRVRTLNWGAAPGGGGRSRAGEAAEAGSGRSAGPAPSAAAEYRRLVSAMAAAVRGHLADGSDNPGTVEALVAGLARRLGKQNRAVLVAATVLVDRLMLEAPPRFSLDQATYAPVLVAAVTISYKSLCHRTPRLPAITAYARGVLAPSYFGKAGAVRRLELGLLQALKWRVAVSREEYDRCLTTLQSSHVESEEQRRVSGLLTSDTAWKPPNSPWRRGSVKKLSWAMAARAAENMAQVTERARTLLKEGGYHHAAIVSSLKLQANMALSRMLDATQMCKYCGREEAPQAVVACIDGLVEQVATMFTTIGVLTTKIGCLCGKRAGTRHNGQCDVAICAKCIVGWWAKAKTDTGEARCEFCGQHRTKPRVVRRRAKGPGKRSGQGSSRGGRGGARAGRKRSRGSPPSGRGRGCGRP